MTVFDLDVHIVLAEHTFEFSNVLRFADLLDQFTVPNLNVAFNDRVLVIGHPKTWAVNQDTVWLPNRWSLLFQ